MAPVLKKNKTTDARGFSELANTTPCTSAEVLELMETCIMAPMDGYPGHEDCLWGLPLLIEGEPGIAKTARIRQLSKSLRVPMVPVYAGRHPPEDFGGALVPDGKGDARQICSIAKVRGLIRHGVGILFLDEISGAAPATQGALMSLIHERNIGDEEIPGRIRILSAANPEEISAGGFRLTPPLANRFLHVRDPGPTVPEWTKWLVGSTRQFASIQKRADAKNAEEPDGTALSILESFIIEDWPDQYPVTQGLFSAFMERNSSLLHHRPPIGNPASGKAWPSPRTWDFAMRAWTTAKILQKDEAIRDRLIECCVGDGAATAFLEYQRETNLPAPMEVLDGTWKINPDRLDIVMAAYVSAIAYVRQRPTKEDKFKLAPLAWQAIDKLFTAQLIDIAIPAAEGLVSEQLSINSKHADISKAAQTVLVKMDKAGLTPLIGKES